MSVDSNVDISQSAVSDAEVFALLREHKKIVISLLLVGCVIGVVAALQKLPGGVFVNIGVGIFAVCVPLLAWIDQRTLRLPDVFTAPLAAVLAVLYVLDVLVGNLTGHELLVGLGNGVGIGILFLIVAIAMSGGLGMGDIKFAIIAGFVLGTKSVTVALFALLIVPPLIALVALMPVLMRFLIVRDAENSLRDLGTYKFAYGPYLGIGSLIGLFIY